MPKSNRKKQLTFQYLLAVGIVFVLSLSTLLTLQYILAKQNSYASIINISGRQRMLSQRTTMLVLHLLESSDASQAQLEDSREKLLKSMALMEESHTILTSGKLADGSLFALSPAIHKMYFDEPLHVDALVSAHIHTIKTLLANPKRMDTETFFQNATTTLLSALDQVVKQYERESNRYTTTLKLIELVFFLITLLVLSAIILFIFRPMVRSVVEHENVLNNMLDHLPVLMDIVSSDHTILYQSKYLVKAMGASMVGRKCYEVYKDDGTQCQDCPLSGSLHNNSNIIEAENCLGGRTLQVAHVPIHFRGQEAILETFTDITEQRQTEQLLIQAKDTAENASKMKSEFLAAISHEIRTPLNAIIGLTYLTLETRVTSKQMDYLNKISSSADQLTTLVTDLLDFSKIETHSLTLKPASFKVADTMDHLASITTYEALEKGLEVNFNIEPDVPLHLIGDQHRLEQTLTQLINNSIKFTNKGYIDINTEYVRTEGEQVTLRFSVNDTGIGIEPKRAAAIFQPFSQGEDTNTRHYGGTGLGLALCKELTELMGGTLQLETKSGPGSLFSFTAVFSKDNRRTQKQPCIPELTGLKALVVDDHPLARRSIEHMLGTFQLQVESSDSPENALHILKGAAGNSTPFDFIITDWQMPGMNGVDFATNVRKNSLLYGTPAILLVTAFSKDETVLLAEEDFDGLLLKPVNRAVLLGTILATCDKKCNSCSTTSTEQNTPLPLSLPGINMQKGQAQVGGSGKIYSSILKKFACNQADQTDAIHRAYTQNDLETAHRLIHTLKGVAGNIGAGQLHDAALALEKEVSTGAPIGKSIFLDKLKVLDIALRQVLDSIHSLYVDTQADRSKDDHSGELKEIDPAQTRPIIDKLAHLLEDSDTEAEQCLDSLADHFQQTEMETKVERLRDMISQYDFEEALELVNTIRSEING